MLEWEETHCRYLHLYLCTYTSFPLVPLCKYVLKLLKGTTLSFILVHTVYTFCAINLFKETNSDERWGKKRPQQHRLQSQVEIRRPCGKKGPAQIGTCYINVERKNRQKDCWATEGPMAGHKERRRKTVVNSSQKLERKKQIKRTFVKPMSHTL